MATKRITKADYLELEEKYNKLQEEYNELKFKLEYYESDFDKSSRENLELQGKIDLLSKMIDIKDDNIQKLTDENKELNNALETKIETIRDLFIQVQELTSENKQLKSNAPVPVVHKHNERNAGRKNKFTDDMIIFVTTLKGYGYTYLEIKQKFWERFGKSISVGSISNIIKNNS